MAGNPNSPSSRAIGADSDHGIVLLPGCNCGSIGSPLSNIDQNTSFDVQLKSKAKVIGRSPLAAYHQDLSGAFNAASSDAVKGTDKHYVLTRMHYSEAVFVVVELLALN
ncbi:hypothetical protein DCAR_0205870 [Daucus carota subsp. sativus]|uniref:Uncharacterized protein n=1 Tax=Daucus carota subsp. sativus TaxID=79200 RepID=A0A166CVH5_DAUCS|nr:hypothetical protein DCAR_0205870 [Daucus carota subsp. sativus]